MENKEMIGYTYDSNIHICINKFRKNRVLIQEGVLNGEGLYLRGEEKYAYVSIAFEVKKCGLDYFESEMLSIKYNVGKSLAKFEKFIIVETLTEECREYIVKILLDFNLIFLASQSEFIITGFTIKNAKMHALNTSSIHFIGATWKAIQNAFYLSEEYEF